MNITVGVFFGSRSPEHDISVITGEFIIAELKKIGYTVVPVYIGKKGDWYIANEVGALKFFTYGSTEEKLASSNFNKFYLDLENSKGKLVFKQKKVFGKNVVIDVAFPALHGSYGEDGTIQGMFEMLGVPYVGCDVASSAIAMDKASVVRMYKAMGIKTPQFVICTKHEWSSQKAKIIAEVTQQLTFPVFVKPTHLGSSIGISKVQSAAALADKVDVAMFYDTKVIIEEGVQNLKDLTVAVMGKEGELETSEIQESVFASDLFNFDEKYLNDGGAQLGRAKSSLVIPASVDTETTREIKELAKKIFLAVGCYGIARVDFLYDSVAREYYAGEINPLPGTLYHHLWKASGFELASVLRKLIQLALDREQDRQKQTFTFNSTVLAQAGSIKLSTKLGETEK